MPSRSILVRWGGLAAVVAGALYVLGAFSSALDYPPAYIFTRLHHRLAQCGHTTQIVL